MSEPFKPHFDAAKLAALLECTDDFIDKIIHERERDNRRAQEELEAMGHSPLIDDELTTAALRLRGELVQAIGELRGLEVPVIAAPEFPPGQIEKMKQQILETWGNPGNRGEITVAPAGATVELITAPDEKQRCCVLDNTGNRCPNRTRYWVGRNPIDEYTHCCEEHLKDVWRPGDAIQDMQTGKMLDELPENMAMALFPVDHEKLARSIAAEKAGVKGRTLKEIQNERRRQKQPPGDSDVAALAEVASDSSKPSNLGICPEGHHLKNGPCRRDYCRCHCLHCEWDCTEAAPDEVDP